MQITAKKISSDERLTVLSGGRKAAKFLSEDAALEIELRFKIALYSEQIKQAKMFVATLRKQKERIRRNLVDLRWKNRRKVSLLRTTKNQNS
jgi:hypothetical protein